MASKRDQILSTITALLDAPGKPAGVIVRRGFTSVFDEIADPDAVGISVAPGEEEVVSVGSSRVPLVDRTLIVAITISGACDAASSPDQRLDPALSWAVSQIAKDRSLGGLALGVEEHKLIWAGEAGQSRYGRVHQLWKVRYKTAGNNQEASA